MERENLEKIAKEKIAEVLEIPFDDVDEKEKLLRMGITSIHAIRIINLLRKELGIEINPVVIFEYNTLEEIVNFLMEEHYA